MRRSLDKIDEASAENEPWLAFPSVSVFDRIRAHLRFIELLQRRRYPMAEPPEALFEERDKTEPDA